MDVNASRPTRHDVLVHALHGLAGLALLMLIGGRREAAAAKVQKEDVAYQDRPKTARPARRADNFPLPPQARGLARLSKAKSPRMVGARVFAARYSPPAGLTQRMTAAATEIDAQWRKQFQRARLDIRDVANGHRGEFRFVQWQ